MTTFMAPINMLNDEALATNRTELEKKMNEEGKLTRFEAQYLDDTVTEQNRRKGIH